MHNDETPCRCPKCAWIGMYRDTDKYVPTNADFNELKPRYVCPRCISGIDVQTLGQKGLDGLRREHELCTKMGYAHVPERMERRAKIERFFEHIGQPLKQPSKTTKAFREMMLSGRMNQLMKEAVAESMDATAKVMDTVLKGEKMKLNLTDAERLILANQYQILAKLEEDDFYKNLSDNLREGHAWLYNQALAMMLSDQLSDDDADYVVTVLSIYDTIKSSYDELADKSGIATHAVEFPGFDGNNEGELLAFSVALRKDRRFEDLIPERGKNSHMDTSHRYKRLIEKYKEMGEPIYPLNKDQILELVS